MTVQVVGVDLGARSYAIHIAPGALDQVGTVVRSALAVQSVLVITDTTVQRHYGERCLQALRASGLRAELCSFPPGETSKTLATAEILWAACAQAGLDRSSAIVALGGGVVGDLAGFVAAAWMRGIPFVQIPTTLLAMVDSSVGGKTGVNASFGKNLIGAFHQPSLVVIDPTVLTTMDAREYRAGLAEVLKYGIIRDGEFLTWQEQHAAELVTRVPAALTHAIATSCRIKAWYVQTDETEQGVRAQLNYGHTFGHALERDTRYTMYLHGEAVGIGCRMAVDLAARIGHLRDHELPGRQDRLLAAYGLPLHHAVATMDAAIVGARLTSHCRLDKKSANGHCRFIVPSAVGAVETLVIDDQAAIAAAFASAFQLS